MSEGKGGIQRNKITTNRGDLLYFIVGIRFAADVLGVVHFGARDDNLVTNCPVNGANHLREMRNTPGI